MYSSKGEDHELSFHKSSYSDRQNCVEVADLPGGSAAVRDSMNPGDGHFTISGTEWAALIEAVRHGQL